MEGRTLFVITLMLCNHGASIDFFFIYDGTCLSSGGIIFLPQYILETSIFIVDTIIAGVEQIFWGLCFLLLLKYVPTSILL